MLGTVDLTIIKIPTVSVGIFCDGEDSNLTFKRYESDLSELKSVSE